MGAKAGKNSVVYVSGTATAMVGEATTQDVTTKIYQITDTLKRALQRTGTVRVHKYGTNAAAEVGTTTTNIKITGHGLQVGDLIINHTRSEAKRLVLVRVDADNVTVAAVTSQTNGDTIERCPTETATNYTLNRLNGTVTYPTAASRTIYISCDYLPLSVAGGGKEFTLTLTAENQDSTIFKSTGTTFVLREQCLKDVSGNISGLYIDDYYKDCIDDDTPILIELFVDYTGSYDARFWGILSNHEASGSVDGLVEYSVDFEGINDDDSRVITFT